MGYDDFEDGELDQSSAEDSGGKSVGIGKIDPGGQEHRQIDAAQQWMSDFLNVPQADGCPYSDI